MKYLSDNQFILGKTSKERFLNPQTVPALKALGVTLAGITDVFDEYLCARNAPLHHRLLISVDGVGWVENQKGQFQILPGQILLLPAGQDFVYKSNQPWKFVWFMFDQTLSTSLLSSILKIESFDYAQEVLQLCILLLLSDDNVLREALGLRLQTLIEKALKRKVESSNESSGSNDLNKLHRLFNNVEQQLHLSWSVEDLSALMFCSKASLHRHCMRQYDCSPMHKITQLRMSRAVDLLKQTDWSIKQIAQQIGFKDPLNFSHRFKQWHNLSPKHYREHK
ncbi:MAG: helix-turn-helix transcriptional regulator [Saccharospirillaceae bacterium]|nr:AraC family transcriptional regulator [Pseudomonadales bacterium]NRB81778.1 helix-turn-helix transcriptional regulator [Saccharospirillaceae bacterium]